MPGKIDIPITKVPNLSTRPVPLWTYTGGGRDETSTTSTTFQTLTVLPTQGVKVTETTVAIIHVVIECRITGGGELKLRIGRTNEGSLPCLENTVVLTTCPNYETRFHMAGFGLPAGDHNLYFEWCVSAGTGYARYGYYTVFLTVDRFVS